MCDFPFRSAVDGNHEVGYPVGRGEGSDARQISPTAFISQDHHANRGGQSVVSGYLGIDPYLQPSSFHHSPSHGPGYYQDSPTPETLEASVSNKAMHSPPADLHPTALSPEIQAYPACDVPVTDHTYGRTEVEFSTRQSPLAPYGGSDTHRISSTSQDHHASRGGQSVVSGYPGIDPYLQSPPFHYSPSHEPGCYQDSHSPTPETLEASVSNNAIHSPPVGLHPTVLTSEAQAYHSYNVQVAGHTYDRTEVDSSTRQFPPVPYEGSYAHRISSTVFNSQDHHTSRGGQSAVSGYTGIDPYVQPSPFHHSPSHGPGYYQDSPTPETLGASVSNKAMHSPPVDLHPAALSPEIQAYPACDVQVTDRTYDRTEVDFSTRQSPLAPYGGSDTHRISSTSQDHHASRGGQSVVSGYPGIDPYLQSPPFHYSPSHGPGYYQDSPTQESLGASVSNNVIHSHPVDLHPTALTPVVQTCRYYNAPVTDHTYDRTEVDFSTRQFPLVPYTGHERGGRFGSLPPFPNPSPDQHHIEDPFSSATPERKHCFNKPKEEFVSDPGGMHQPYSVATKSPPTPKVTRRRNVQKRTGFGSQTPKKKKLAATPDKKPGVERARRWILRRSIYTRESTKVVPPAVPLMPLRLRVVEQVSYNYDVTQTGWTPLETIDFGVKGVKGMRLIDAVNLRFDGPDERDELMFQSGVGTSVSCRIHFKKYPACNRPRQVVTTDHTKERAPITKKKLAHEVAKCIDFYLMELEDNKTPFSVRFQDMYLTKLVNVSRASWQPEIYQVDPSVSS